MVSLPTCAHCLLQAKPPQKTLHLLLAPCRAFWQDVTGAETCPSHKPLGDDHNVSWKQKPDDDCQQHLQGKWFNYELDVAQKGERAPAQRAALSPARSCTENPFSASQEDNGAQLNQLRAGADPCKIGMIHEWFEDYKNSKFWRANVTGAPRRENNCPFSGGLVFFSPPERSVLLLPNFVRDFLASAPPCRRGMSAVLKTEQIGVRPP